MAVEQHFAVKEPYSEYSWALGDGMLRLNRHGTPGAWFWLGEFISPHGMVSVMREATFTRLDYATDGRAYSRTWRRYFGDRTVTKLARAFISDVKAPR